MNQRIGVKSEKGVKGVKSAQRVGGTEAGQSRCGVRELVGEWKYLDHVSEAAKRDGQSCFSPR